MRRFQPTSSSVRYDTIIPTSFNETSIQLTRSASLRSGAFYNVKVTGLNRAELSKTYDSIGVIVDTTGPSMIEVSQRLIVTSSCSLPYCAWRQGVCSATYSHTCHNIYNCVFLCSSIHTLSNIDYWHTYLYTLFWHAGGWNKKWFKNKKIYNCQMLSTVY